MTYGLLDGVRVVELSMYAFAPSATAILADWGADVIKVVPPDVADPMRGNPVAGLPERDVGIAFMWELMNRGKRCVGIDVSQPAGREVLYELVAEADVFVTNLLPDARRRFEIDIDDLRGVKPELIYARASGHGPKGPESGVGGFDHTDFWARTGIGHAASMASGAFVAQVGPAMGDLSSGAFLAGGIAAALVRRQRTGEGGVVDVSLLSSGTWMFAPSVMASQLYDIETIPRPRHHDLPNPLVAAYTTKDERDIYFAGVQTDRHFDAFCHAIGHPELLDDERFGTLEARQTNAAACIEALDAVFAMRTLAEWLDVLAGVSTPWSVVQSAREAGTDEQVRANGYVTSVDTGTVSYPTVASPVQFDERAPELTPAPDHGEHTDAVLAELGYGPTRVGALRSAGVVS